MTPKMHKLLTTRCDIRPDMPMVTAADCSRCPHGSVVDNRSRVLCYGVTKFFMVPCFYEMRAGATLDECDRCPHGEVSEDRMRVFCDRI
jgi:hypothetical protein